MTGPDIDLRDDDGGNGSDVSISTLLLAGDYQQAVSAADRGNGSYTLSADTIRIQNNGIATPGDRF